MDFLIRVLGIGSCGVARGGGVRWIAPLSSSRGERVSPHSLHSLLSYVAVSLSRVPDGGALKGLSTFEGKSAAQETKTV